MNKRAFWLRQLQTWHWISAAFSLSGMLLFAATGLTLNHAGSIRSSTAHVAREAALPADLQAQLMQWPEQTRDAVFPGLADWVWQTLSVDIREQPTETTAEEIYIDMPMPGGDRAVTIDRTAMIAVFEQTTRGWIAYLNDLHKGRNTGAVWFWFIDVMAASCIIFTLTGLGLLALNGRSRPSTWPVTGFSMLAPLLIALLFIH